LTLGENVTVTNAIHLGDEISHKFIYAWNGANVLDTTLYTTNSKIITTANGATLTLRKGAVAEGLYLACETSAGNIFIEETPLAFAGKTLFAGGLIPTSRVVLNVAGNMIQEVSVYFAGGLQWGLDNVLPADIAFSCDDTFGYFDLHGHSQTVGALVGGGNNLSTWNGNGRYPYLIQNRAASGRSFLTIAPTADGYGPAIIGNGVDAVKTGTATMNLIKPVATDGSLTVSAGTLGLGGQVGTASALILDGGKLIGGTLRAPTNTLRSGTLAASLQGGDIVKEGTGTVTMLASAEDRENSVSVPIGTVAYWPFDSEATLLKDASTNGVDLAVDTAELADGHPVFAAEGHGGGALYLDGSTCLTQAGLYPENFPTGAMTYTVAALIKPDADCPWSGGIFGIGVSGACNCLRLDNDSIKNYWWGNDKSMPFPNAANPRDGNWHSVVVTYTGTERRMYLDGEFVGRWFDDKGFPNVPRAKIRVGKTIGGANDAAAFKGYIDDLLVLNRVMTPAEAAAWHRNGARAQIAGSASPTRKVEVKAGTLACSALSSAGLCAYWKFDSEAGLLKDSGPYGVNLIQDSGSTGRPLFAPYGRMGGALYLDGNTWLVSATGTFPSALPTGNASYTVAAYIRADIGSPDNGGWIGWGSNASGMCNNFRIAGWDVAKRYTLVNNYWWAHDVQVAFPKGATYVDNNWHSVIGTFDNATGSRKLYVDGVVVDERTDSGLNLQPNLFFVGRTTADIAFKGWVDELVVFNRTLSAEEIGVMMASGVSTAAFPTNTALTVEEGATLTLADGMSQSVATLGGNGMISGGQLTVTGELVASNLVVISDLTLATNSVIVADIGSDAMVGANAVDLSGGGTIRFTTPITGAFSRSVMSAESFGVTGKLADWTVEGVPSSYKSAVYVSGNDLVVRVYHPATVISLR
jgi:hypothetical protein